LQRGIVKKERKMKSEYEYENEYKENDYCVDVDVNFYGRLTTAEQRPYFSDKFTY
jgi:hypothetical protein